MYTLTIEPKTNPDQPERKSRIFRVVKLAHVSCNALWAGGEADTDDVRPVWLMLTGTPTELRPFLANLRMGKRADLGVLGESKGYSRSKPTRFGLLKSAGYQFTTQQLSTGEAVVTAYLPDVLRLDPGMIDPERVSFLALPPQWWVVRQRSQLRGDQVLCAQILRHLSHLTLPVALSPDERLDLVPEAMYVAAYLEQRTRRPMPSAPAFALQLLLAGLQAGIFSYSQTEASTRAHSSYYGNSAVDTADRWWFARHKWALSFVEVDTHTVGLCSGVVCMTTHAALDPFLAAQVQQYLAISGV